MPDNDIYRFELVLDGELVENSVDAFDVANTIIAFTTATREMIRIKYGDDAAQRVTINVNAFKQGSLETPFILLFNDPTVQEHILPLATAGLTASYGAYKIGKEALGMVKDYISVKKWLKGKSPDRVTTSPGGDTYIIHANNSTINIGADSFKALQDKTVQRNMDKVVNPLDKEGSQLETLEIKTQDDKPREPLVDITRAEAKYVRHGEGEVQAIDGITLKGVITKIDTKVRSGYLNLGNMSSRRVAFTYPKSLSRDEFDILIQSLRTQVQIYIKGVVDMDLEGKPKSIDATNIREDEKLL